MDVVTISPWYTLQDSVRSKQVGLKGSRLVKCKRTEFPREKKMEAEGMQEEDSICVNDN